MSDSVAVRLGAVRVTGKPVFAASPLADVTRTAVLVGKKTESVNLGLADVNLATSNQRQSFARSPGVFLWEQDGGGVQGGVAVRGLSPNRSWEFNSRQDGADISSDPFGYPEAYYTPVFESLERIEIVRGAASLQYGPQYGGLLNYVVKTGALDRPFAIENTQTAGGNGLYATYTGVGGTVGDVNYYGYANVRRGDSWRRNNDFSQRAFYGSASTAVPTGGRLGAAVTYMDYEMRQPGGLTEQQFAADARQSVRARDWFGTPWLVPTVTYEHMFGTRTFLTAKGFGLVGERNSIGLTVAPTTLDTAATPLARRLDRDEYRNMGGELRLVHTFSALGTASSVASGLRASRGHTSRESGRGPDGSEFDVRFVAPQTTDLDFTTQNLAAFTELKLALTDRLSLAPGVRVEHLRATGEGNAYRAGATFERADTVQRMRDRRASETVPLFGLGASFRAGHAAELYGNVAQAYRPVVFSDQFPADLVAVDPSLRSSRGVSSDVGVRGTVGRVLTYDVGGFYLVYGDRVGTLSRGALGADSVLYPNGLRKNIGESRHYGLESFAELDATRLVGGDAAAARLGSTLFFVSAGRTIAYYSDGPQRGKQVEYSPDWIVRGGLTYRLRDRLSATLQGSSVSAAFADANNSPRDPNGNGLAGQVPAYSVWDVSAKARLFSGVALEASLNNAFDERYFTRRAGGYPGPGIVPAEGRTVAAGLRLNLPGGSR